MPQTGRRMRVPFRRLQSEFFRAGEKKDAQEWKRVGGLIDRNFDELRDADSRATFTIFDRDADVPGTESKPWSAVANLRVERITADIPGGEAFSADLLVDDVVEATITSASGTQAREPALVPGGVVQPSLQVDVREGQVLKMDCPDLGFDLVITVVWTYR